MKKIILVAAAVAAFALAGCAHQDAPPPAPQQASAGHDHAQGGKLGSGDKLGR